MSVLVTMKYKSKYDVTKSECKILLVVKFDIKLTSENPITDICYKKLAGKFMPQRDQLHKWSCLKDAFSRTSFSIFSSITVLGLDVSQSHNKWKNNQASLKMFTYNLQRQSSFEMLLERDSCLYSRERYSISGS